MIQQTAALQKWEAYILPNNTTRRVFQGWKTLTALIHTQETEFFIDFFFELQVRNRNQEYITETPTDF